MGIGRIVIIVLVSYLIFSLLRRLLNSSSNQNPKNQKKGSIRVFGKRGLEKSKIKNLDAETVQYEEIEQKSEE